MKSLYDTAYQHSRALTERCLGLINEGHKPFTPEFQVACDSDKRFTELSRSMVALRAYDIAPQFPLAD